MAGPRGLARFLQSPVVLRRETLSLAYALVEPGAPLVGMQRPVPMPGPGEVRIRVAGCGLCHTDLGFAFGGVRTRHPLPLVLGHEISGIVEAAGLGAEAWLGEAVVVPAVLPCGECEDCRVGAPMICAKQVFPGNDIDGGFAEHVIVPARGLCRVPGADADFDRPLGSGGATLRHLSVLADAASTAAHAVERAGGRPGDVAVVVGLGGVGGYAIQLLALQGLYVVGIDPSADRRTAALANGASVVIDPAGQVSRDIKAQISGSARGAGAPRTRWHLFECSGTQSGQELAFALLVHGATLAVVGYTLATVTVRLSNLMALDAKAYGTWGCPPELYPALVQLVLDGRLDVRSSTTVVALDSLPVAFAAVHQQMPPRRLVFAPSFLGSIE